MNRCISTVKKGDLVKLKMAGESFEKVVGVVVRVLRRESTQKPIHVSVRWNGWTKDRTYIPRELTIRS